MSKRLASFRGPSSPSTTPVKTQPANTPASPSRNVESTFHRKVRSALLDIRSITETWEDLVLVDGLKAARTLVDARTELDNVLNNTPDRLPQTHVVGDKIAIMDKQISDLDDFLLKLNKQFKKLNMIVDGLETLLQEAHKTKGWQWVQEEPLWVTWSLERFVTTIPNILIPYHRSLAMHTNFVDLLRVHTISFDESRDTITAWVEQPWLEESSWTAYWEDLCAAEIGRWES